MNVCFLFYFFCNIGQDHSFIVSQNQVSSMMHLTSGLFAQICDSEPRGLLVYYNYYHDLFFYYFYSIFSFFANV